jgi:hypothetical protein
MNETPEHMWELMMRASNELCDELGLEEPPPVFTPERALGAADAWVEAQPQPLDQEETARLGFLLARVLVETHGGGITRIAAAGHPLDGEWAVSGFTRGLDADYYVPFVVSAVRIGMDRSLSARDWYAQTLREGILK